MTTRGIDAGGEWPRPIDATRRPDLRDQRRRDPVDRSGGPTPASRIPQPAACIGRVAARLLIFVLLALLARPAAAQLSPDADWHTLRTEHFHIHFVPALEVLARRAAVSAESAYVRLARELVPPRGPIDLVISDDADFSNGWATPFPTNRIVVYAHPPAEGQTLRYYHDWMTLVITHELTHIFHLDRTRGWWRAAQFIFGRNPLLFPNQYQPRWVSEGVAVYYESKLTGFGRLAGTEHMTLARTTFLQGATPALHELSLATPRFPGGQAAYAYGSLLFDHLAETRGEATIPRFLERASGAVIPFTLNRSARRAFGISLTDAWDEWRDSLQAEAGEAGPPLPQWRMLTREGRFAHHPRWLDDTSLVYSASTGRDVAGAYRVTLGGDVDRLGRRNGLDPNVPLPGGGLLFSQPELVSPYVIRSDLYIERDDDVRRLTHGARLAFPDARHDGEIVAMQAGAGTTRLARVSPDGRVRDLTIAHPDTQWSVPRWSPDGTRIVAIRWTRGALNEIVVLDTLGRVEQVLVRERAVLGNPTWTPDGAAVVYSSDRTGATELHRIAATPPPRSAEPIGSAAQPARGAERVSSARTALVEPAVSADGRTIAASHFRADGYHIGVGALPPAGVAAAGSLAAEGLPRDSLYPASTLGADSAVVDVPPAQMDEGPISRYSPWRSLVPRYWLPTLIEVTTERTLFGAMTGGNDIVGRHSYALNATLSSDAEEMSAELGWRYAGLGQPVIDLSLARYLDPPFTVQGGEITTAEDRAAVSLGVSRPRYRTAASASLGYEISRFTAAAEPAPLLDQLGILDEVWRHGVFASVGWSNARRPTLAISPEDGISMSLSARRRWLALEERRPSTLVLGGINAYKALDLPGYAHHVIALRGAFGLTDHNSADDFEIGGTSGSSALLVPGVAIGDPRRRFGVRGFPVVEYIELDGELVPWRGTRAIGWTAEYRAPLFIAARGLGLLPLFFDRTSVALFAEGAAVWCPAPSEPSLVCPDGGIPRTWLGSAGAEVILDAAVLTYDFPYRFRLGVARPYQGRRYATRPVSVYLTLGLAF